MSDTTTDRELLQLAAKAAGITRADARVIGDCPGMWFYNDSRKHPMCRKPNRRGNVPWNPLVDDGDALRLAVKLGLSLQIDLTDSCTRILNEFDGVLLVHMHFADDPESATRRAIVRAAAELGKRMSPLPMTAQEGAC